MYTALRKSLNKENDKGFTLIELLVVIIIIGILAAIAIPIFLNQRKKATEASMKSDARTIATQMETYFTDLQEYPASLALADVSLSVGDETVVLSPGNVPAVYAPLDGPAFCVEITNDKVADKTVVYRSDLGGIQGPDVTGCDTAVFTGGDIVAPAAPVVP